MRLVVFLSVPFVLLLSVLLLLGADSSTPTAHAQAVDGATARQLFLPLIATSAHKSGIHLGNRGADWQDEFLTSLRGTRAREWPAAVVVLSDHLTKSTGMKHTWKMARHGCGLAYGGRLLRSSRALCSCHLPYLQRRVS